MTSLKSNTTSYCVVLSACILIVLGDLRNLISPVGYWTAWLGIGLVGFTSTSYKFSSKVSRELFVYIVGFGVLCISFVLSALINLDTGTFYQGLKIVCISIIFICVYSHSQRLKGEDYYSISVIAIGVGFFSFLLAKYYLTAWHVVLGDGREGSQFAFPGVLWKTCAFFIGFLLVGIIFDKKNKVVGLLCVMAAAYVLTMDSSRTGFIIIAVVMLLVFLLSIHIKPKFTALLLFLFVVVVTVLLVLYNFGYDFLNYNNSPLVLDRLEAGDPIRTQMLADGLTHFQKCMPLGCGFGSTTTEVNGGPMVVHNAFLSSGGDLGILGVLGLAILILTPWYVFALRLYQYAFRKCETKKTFIYTVAALGGSLGYGLLMMLHPFSTELSEWGIWIVMVSALSALSHQSVGSYQVENTGAISQ